MAKKYLNFGKIKKFENQQYAFFDFDLNNLKEFVEILTAYGKEHMAGRELKEVYQDIKDKKIPQLSVCMFDPSSAGEYPDKDYILKKFCLKLEE